MRLAVMAVAAICCTAATVSAQTAQAKGWDANHNGWYMYFGDHQVRGRWGVHLEGQLRRNEIITAWQQLLLRPGLNYQPSKHTLLTLGYAYVKTHPYGSYAIKHAFPEHRLYQQVLARQSAGRVRIQHRFRLEQRFMGQVIPSGGGEAKLDSWRYQNRFRQFLKVEVPLGRKSEEVYWYLAAYNEVFLHLPPNLGARVFDQNRAYGALGRGLGKAGKLEIGYLHQLLAHRSGRVLESNHTLQVGFFSNVRFGKR